MPDHSINQRIIELAKYKNLNEIGMQEALGHEKPQKTYNVFGKKTGVGVEYLKDVLNKFKEVSADWLVMGRGEMLTSQKEEPSHSLIDKEVLRLRKEVYELEIENRAYLKAFEAQGIGMKGNEPLSKTQ